MFLSSSVGTFVGMGSRRPPSSFFFSAKILRNSCNRGIRLGRKFAFQIRSAMTMMMGNL